MKAVKHPLCAENPAYAHLKIHEGGSWRLLLHPDQRYLGRSIVWLTSRHVSRMPFEALKSGEVQELFSILRKLNVALNRLCKPGILNYCWLGNYMHEHDGHGHMHVIPRYEKAPVFNGVSYPDERWGSNYAPYEKLSTPDESLLAIRDAIRSRHVKFKY